MIQLIVGEKGKGKTKILLDKVNEAAKSAKGNLVFIDKDSSHMFELKNSIRLVNVGEYRIRSSEEFSGFVSGIISADHDLEQLFIDTFLISAAVKGADYVEALRKIDEISAKFNVSVTVSISVTKDDLPEDLKNKVVVAL
ncbi:MAG: twitching motility protein PilT [Lachnospiraceae bacterium]|nr:twitching motility protein PilT [Lachnospiraceae bacterium]